MYYKVPMTLDLMLLHEKQETMMVNHWLFRSILMVNFSRPISWSVAHRIDWIHALGQTEDKHSVY